MGAPVKSVTSSDCCCGAKSHALGDNSNASLLKTVGNLTDLFKMGLQTETAIYMVLAVCLTELFKIWSHSETAMVLSH